VNQRLSGLTVLDQLKGSPRFALLMLISLPTAIALGAKEIARLEYVTEVFGSAGGIGTVGVVVAVAVALGGATSGPLCDRINPRGVLIISMLGVACSNVISSTLILRGELTVPIVLVIAALDGGALGIGAPALLKVQAALVPGDARGSAEIVNIFRLSLGAVVGLVLASLSPSPAFTLLVGGGVTFVVAAGVAWLTSGMSATVMSTALAGHVGLWSTLVALPSLRYVVIADLVFTFAIPTQLSNVILAEEGDVFLVLPVLLAGVVGVLIGRLALIATGSTGNVRRQLLIAVGSFIGIALLAVPLTVAGFTLDSGLTSAVFILAGSAASSYVLGLLSALVQQAVPDDVRGALSGFMAAARSLLIAGAAALITAVIVPLSSLAVLITVCTLAVVALAVVRGFAGVTAYDAGPSGPVPPR
jgi:hypothetical protein